MRLDACVAALGLVSLAAGGASASLTVLDSLCVELTFDRDVISVGETAVATVTASWDGPAGSYLSLVNVDLLASSADVTVGGLAGVAWNNAATGMSGTGLALGADVFGLEAGQHSALGAVDASHPIVITSFTVTATGTTDALTFSALLGGAGADAFRVGRPLPGELHESFGTEVFKSGSLRIVPTPGGLAVLGLGGLAAARRRR